MSRWYKGTITKQLWGPQDLLDLVLNIRDISNNRKTHRNGCRKNELLADLAQIGEIANLIWRGSQNTGHTVDSVMKHSNEARTIYDSHSRRKKTS